MPDYALPDMPTALRQTPLADLPYLQILPPYWLLSDPLYSQIECLAKLYRNGRVVWAYVVQAPKELYDARDYRSSQPATVVFDPEGRTAVSTLQAVVEHLLALKGGGPNSATDTDDAEIRACAAHLREEDARYIGSVPAAISRQFAAPQLCMASVFIWRLHLPNGLLSMPFFPVLTDGELATVLPARYWQHTDHYRDWLASSPDTGHDPAAELTPTLLAAVREAPDFWQGYQEVMHPQADELPELGTDIDPAADTPASIPDPNAHERIERFRRLAGCDYPRWMEVTKGEVPPEADIRACMADLQAGANVRWPAPVESRAVIRLLTFQPHILALLHILPEHAEALVRRAEDAMEYREARYRANYAEFLREAVHAATQVSPPLSASAIAHLVMALIQSVAGDTDFEERLANDTLLAWLYASGQHTEQGLPQSLPEASRYLTHAISLGHAPSCRLLAEMLLVSPLAAYDLIGTDTHREAIQMQTNLILHAKEVQPTETLCQRYLNHPKAVLENVRRLLLRAASLGDVGAQKRLDQLIAQGDLPAQVDMEYSSIGAWLEKHLTPHPDAPPVTNHIVQDEYGNTIIYSESMPDEPDGKPRWLAVLQILLALVMVVLMVMLVI